ncbi:MAG: nuclear transport factor 2 family protein [Nitratireductor sp.]|nr:nuclear transport factor 2 family protein [Nitratireductor sp.]
MPPLTKMPTPFIWVAAALLTNAAVLPMTGPAAANGDLPAPVQTWYGALGAVDRSALEDVLADDARIDLRDLGIVQTRDEFLDSLDAWAEANKNAEILTRPGKATGNNAIAVEVCYRFPSNEVLFEETFELTGEKITRSVQQQLSENCEGF